MLSLLFSFRKTGSAQCSVVLVAFTSTSCDKINEKNAQRDANIARALAVVRFGHRPPARPLSQTHRQDRLQYTAPQLASAQCT